MSDNKMVLHFGALAESLQIQLHKQKIDCTDQAQYQSDADAITRLVVRGLLSGEEAAKARERLINKMRKVCRPRSERSQ